MIILVLLSSIILSSSPLISSNNKPISDLSSEQSTQTPSMKSPPDPAQPLFLTKKNLKNLVPIPNYETLKTKHYENMAELEHFVPNPTPPVEFDYSIILPEKKQGEGLYENYGPNHKSPNPSLKIGISWGDS